MSSGSTSKATTNKERSDKWQDISLRRDFWQPGMAYLYRGERKIVSVINDALAEFIEKHGRLEADLTHPGTVGFLKEEARAMWPDTWFNIDIVQGSGRTDVEVAEYQKDNFAVLIFDTGRQETEADALLLALAAGIKATEERAHAIGEAFGVTGEKND